MVTKRVTPRGLSLAGQRVIVGQPEMGAPKSVVLVKEDKELLLEGSFSRFLLCFNEQTGLMSDVHFSQVVLKPGDTITANYPKGVKGPPVLWEEETVDGQIVEVYPAAPAGEFTLLGFTRAGYFVVKKRTP